MATACQDCSFLRPSVFLRPNYPRLIILWQASAWTSRFTAGGLCPLMELHARPNMVRHIVFVKKIWENNVVFGSSHFRLAGHCQPLFEEVDSPLLFCSLLFCALPFASSKLTLRSFCSRRCSQPYPSFQVRWEPPVRSSRVRPGLFRPSTTRLPWSRRAGIPWRRAGRRAGVAWRAGDITWRTAQHHRFGTPCLHSPPENLLPFPPLLIT